MLKQQSLVTSKYEMNSKNLVFDWVPEEEVESAREDSLQSN